jgi:hypothetical protein
MPSSCKDLLILRDSLINGFILVVFIRTKYIITWVLIKEAMGRPTSDNVEMLHADFEGLKLFYNILYVFFHIMIFPVGLKYHKKYYFWLLEAWLYIRGGICPYTIFHNCSLKWDGSACQRVYMRGWQVVVQNLRKVFAKKIKLSNPFWQFLNSPFETTLMINDISEKIVFFSFCEWFMIIKKHGGRWKSLLKSQYFCFIY